MKGELSYIDHQSDPAHETHTWVVSNHVNVNDVSMVNLSMGVVVVV